MNFNLQLLDAVPVEQINNSEGRHYLYENERYESVTNFLGKMLNTEEYLNRWRKRVGESEAARITSQAARRGTAVHSICEKYLRNDPKYNESAMPIFRESFRGIKPHLDNNVKVVYGIEQQMVSRKYKLAGTADLICKWGEANCIVDFKTSLKKKRLEWIDGYLYQSSIYGEMVEELYGIPIHGIVVIIDVDNERFPQVFKQVRAPIIKKFDLAYHNYLDSLKKT